MFRFVKNFRFGMRRAHEPKVENGAFGRRGKSQRLECPLKRCLANVKVSKGDTVSVKLIQKSWSKINIRGSSILDGDGIYDRYTESVAEKDGLSVFRQRHPPNKMGKAPEVGTNKARVFRSDEPPPIQDEDKIILPRANPGLEDHLKSERTGVGRRLEVLLVEGKFNWIDIDSIEKSQVLKGSGKVDLSNRLIPVRRGSGWVNVSQGSGKKTGMVLRFLAWLTSLWP